MSINAEGNTHPVAPLDGDAALSLVIRAPMDALGRRYSTVHDTLHRLKRAGLVESVKGEAGSFGRPPLEWRLTDDGVSAKAELILGEGI